MPVITPQGETQALGIKREFCHQRGAMMLLAPGPTPPSHRTPGAPAVHKGRGGQPTLPTGPPAPQGLGLSLNKD